MARDASIRTAADAGAWLEGLINHERRSDFSYERLDLEAIRRLLARLGHPERQLSILHVAGSKGKGSTCLLAEAVLRAAGERVGTFTSPHLERWTERFRVDGAEVTGPDLAAVVEAVRPHVEDLRSQETANAPTFFDATTAVALLLFARSGVDRAVLEVGLGGRLDSTNAVEPAVTVVTQIEYEHTDKLGRTLAEIAGEKAGIIKQGVPCVIGTLLPEAEKAIRARADAVGAPVDQLGRDFQVERLPGSAIPSRDSIVQRFTYREPGFEAKDLALSVLGAHQIDNAALALAAVRRLGDHDSRALGIAAAGGFRTASLPGRLELLSDRPLVIVDAAHTDRSARSLGLVLGDMPAGRRHLVLSISSDKDPAAILRALSFEADEFWLTRAEPTRSLDLPTLAGVVAEHSSASKIHQIEDPRQAVRAAHAVLTADDLLCCAGSVYLAGAARSALRELGVGLARP